MLRDLFADEGYAVDVAANGQTGLHYGLTRSYDVVVLDRRLPVVEGLELVRTWRAPRGHDPDPGAVGAGQPRRAGRGARRGRRGLPGQAVRRRRAAGPAARAAAPPPRPGPGPARRAAGAWTSTPARCSGVGDAPVALSERECALLATLAHRPQQVFSPRRPARAGLPRGREPGRRRHLRPLPAAQARPRASSTPSAAAATGSAAVSMTDGEPPSLDGPESVLVRRAARRLGLQAAAFVAVAVVLGHRGRGRRAAARPGTGGHQPAGRDDRAGRRRRRPAARHLAGDPRRARAETPPRGLPAGADDPAAFAAVVAGGPPTTTEHRVGGVTYRTMTERRTDGFVVQAVLDLTPRQDDRSRILAAMLTAGAAGLVLAAAGGTWLAGARCEPLSAALALQRRFVADAGHELRTPLTLLGTRAQLLRRRLQQVRDGGDAATGLVGRRPAHGRHPRRPRPVRRRRRRGRQRAPHRDPRGPAAARRTRAPAARSGSSTSRRCAATRCGRRLPLAHDRGVALHGPDPTDDAGRGRRLGGGAAPRPDGAGRQRAAARAQHRVGGGGPGARPRRRHRHRRRPGHRPAGRAPPVRPLRRRHVRGRAGSAPVRARARPGRRDRGGAPRRRRRRCPAGHDAADHAARRATATVPGVPRLTRPPARRDGPSPPRRR